MSEEIMSEPDRKNYHKRHNEVSPQVQFRITPSDDPKLGIFINSLARGQKSSRIKNILLDHIESLTLPTVSMTDDMVSMTLHFLRFLMNFFQSNKQNLTRISPEERSTFMEIVRFIKTLEAKSHE